MKVLSLLVVVLLATIVAAEFDFLSDTIAWRNFQRDFNKRYADKSERDMRFKIFQRNLRLAEEQNAFPGQQARFGVTQFMDLTTDEFRMMFLMPHQDFSHQHSLKEVEKIDAQNTNGVNSGPPPTSFNWYNSGACTPVYNQEQCGSCWAFSTGEEIESQWFLTGHNLTSLSVQQIVSCDTTDGGCNGGNPPTAYQYVIRAGGLETWASYPYTSGAGNTGYCKFNKALIVASISNWAWVSRSDPSTPNGNETAMLYGSYQYGPLSICVDASSWQTYQGGIITRNCGKQIDHCVQLVGWNTASNINYWIVRNSWGVTWGERGFIWVERNLDLCAIANEVTRAIV